MQQPLSRLNGTPLLGPRITLMAAFSCRVSLATASPDMNDHQTSGGTDAGLTLSAELSSWAR
jgi:hypothetical protein